MLYPVELGVLVSWHKINASRQQDADSTFQSRDCQGAISTPFSLVFNRFMHGATQKLIFPWCSRDDAAARAPLLAT